MTPPPLTSASPSKPTRFLGIDVGQDRLELVLLQADEPVHVKSFRNDTAGHEVLLGWLGRFTGGLRARSRP